MDVEKRNPETNTKKKNKKALATTFRFGQAIITYTTFIYATGNLILSVISCLELFNADYAVIKSVEETIPPDALGLSSVIIAVLLWVSCLISFILMQIVYARKQFEETK
jgi:hypothetical protein